MCARDGRLYGVKASSALYELQTPGLMRAQRCLHHIKEAKKISRMQTEFRKREAATPRDDAPSAGQIRSLGLLDRKNVDVDMKGGTVLPTMKDNVQRGKDDLPGGVLKG